MVKKKFTIIFIILISLQTIFTPVVLSASVNGTYISSQAACVMDYETGEILYEHNANTKRAPASMVKLMTAYCVYDAIRAGKINFDTLVPISENVYKLSRNPEYKNVRLNYDTPYTVDEMLSVVIVYSACASATALAELISGSEQKFVTLMNDTAKKMGIDAVFYDSHGVENSMASPLAMVTLSRNLIKEFPDIINRTSKKTVTFHKKTYESTNELLSSNYYEGADGLKTGTTSAAGYCFCGTAVKNNRRVIAVTMGSSSEDTRFSDMITLLNYGFATLEKKNLPGIYTTDIKTFINNEEIPTYSYKYKDTSKAVIIAEDLINYGFSLSYDDSKKVLTAYYNKKESSPLEIKQEAVGTKKFDIINDNQITVKFIKGNTAKIINDAYNINGKMAININELGFIYNYNWNSEDKIAYVTTDENASIYYTDIKTKINGNEVPTYIYNDSKTSYAVIIAENLNSYGFDIKYDDNLKQLSLFYKKDKETNPISNDLYKGQIGKKAFDLFESKIKVSINANDNIYIFDNSFSTNGYMIIPIDEFSKFADFNWDSKTKTADIKL